MKVRRTAFTLTEVLAVIFIIALLIAMITVAVSKVMESSRTSATRTILQTGVSIFEEWKRRGATDYPTYAWPLYTTVDGSATQIQLVPGDLKPGSPDLQGLGVGLTRGAMRRFADNTSVQRMITNMPSERFAAIAGFTGAAAAPPNPSNIGQEFSGNYDKRAGEPAGARYFICYNGPGAVAFANAPTQTDPATWPADWRQYWLESSTGGINCLLDAWNNPILFIPACGFQALDVNNNFILVTSDGIKTNNQIFPTGTTFLDRLTWATARSYTAGQIVMDQTAKSPMQWGLYVCIQNHGSLANNRPDSTNGKKFWDRLPTVPFFASAGSDGIFFDPTNPSTLEDNIYSTER